MVIILLSYLIGSIPTAYIAARYLRGFDIRQRGSGHVGGSNIWHSVSRKVAIAVTLVDIGKGILAVLLAKALGLDLSGQVVAGLAVVCGHNWSVFLKFSGGRGIATLGGVILVLATRETVVFACFALLGLVLKAAPVGVILGVAALPVSAVLFREPAEFSAGMLALFFVVLVKRLLPKRKWPAQNWGRVMCYRALFDRDIRDRKTWIGANRQHTAGRRD